MEDEIYSGGTLPNVDIVASNKYKITVEQLKAICPNAPKNVDVFVPYLNEFMPQYSIVSIDDIRCFLAQIAHESGQFRYTQEISSGKAYEGRKDLGNIYVGDGVRFRGAGLIQITGRDNYRQCGEGIGVDLITNPSLLTTPQYAVKSACWYWQSRHLSQISNDQLKKYTFRDKQYDWFQYQTIKINGGLNGFDDRLQFLEKAKKVIC